MYEKGDGKKEAQPESGSADTGVEGAPNQGIEKR
jgi:photosystem I subunit 4